MRLITNRTIYLSLILLFVSPVAALAIPAITCHCFTDRTYDPAQPTLADPYFLATTQNAFFAAVFAIDKKTLVIKKQKGAATADLWIAYWLAARSGSNPESLLQSRQSKGSWQQVVVPLGIATKNLGGKFTEALQTKAPDDRLADTVVDELLLRFRFYGEADLVALRKAGAGNQELILAAMIASRTRQPSLQLYLAVKNGSKSWGALLEKAKISPTEIQQEIGLLISQAR